MKGTLTNTYKYHVNRSVIHLLAEFGRILIGSKAGRLII